MRVVERRAEELTLKLTQSSGKENHIKTELSAERSRREAVEAEVHVTVSPTDRFRAGVGSSELLSQSHTTPSASGAVPLSVVTVSDTITSARSTLPVLVMS